ncbi:helix-turn-helix domain-containing protein [Streptomyces sp. NBC_01298]|uniref:helix-turn-helix domain-containing protein n=1 Tax=Streptomyces sp. NBC_01298 TaxID=2903817 RepID=UPI002E142C47|nr:helix-turn-helix domain-containing protein [Streptomyces sp. NBC_01298]
MSNGVDQILQQPLFGRRLRALRLAQGFSQVQLAGTEISPAYLSRLESGARPPTERVVAYLCEKLKVSSASFQTTTGSSLARVLATVMTVGESPAMAAVLEETLLQEQEEDVDAVLRWQAQWALARCYQTQGRMTEELALLHEMTALGDRTGLPELRARSRVRLARRLRGSGDVAGARAHAEEGLALAEASGLPHRDIVEALLTLISIEAEEGQLAQARADADRMVGTLSDGSAKLPLRLQVEVLWTASSVCARQGDHTAAAATMTRALAALPGNEDPVLWMRLRLAAASMYLRMDPRDTQEARLRLDEAEAVSVLVGMPVHQNELLLLQCQLAFCEGRFDDAHTLSGRLDDNPEGLSVRDQLRLDVLRDQIEIVRGDHAAAVADLERIAKEAQRSVNVELSAEVWRALAEALKLAES